MSLPVSRRTFLGASGVAAASVALPSPSSAFIKLSASRPAAVSSSNGLAAVNRAMELVLGGMDTLDAAVEGMRRGLKPTDACLETLKRVVRLTPPRLLKEGRPTFNLSFYAVNKQGDFGSASLYPAKYAAHDGKSGTLRDTAFLYERRP